MTSNPLVSILLLRTLSDAREHTKVLALATDLLEDSGPGDLDQETAAAYRTTILSFAAVSAYELNQFARSLEFAQRSVTEAEGTVMPSLARARARGQRAVALEALGELVRAEEDYLAALSMAEALPVDDAARDLQALRTNYSDFLTHRGQKEAAAKLMVMAAGTSWGVHASDRVRVSHGRNLMERDPEGAKAGFDDILRRAKEDGDLKLAGVAASNLGMVFFELGEYDQAREYLNESSELLGQLPPSEHLAMTNYNLGLTLQNLDRDDEAVVHLKRALALFSELTPRSIKILPVLRHLAMVRLAQRDFRRARAALRRGIELYESLRPEVGRRESEHQHAFANYRLLIELHLYLSLQEEWLDEIFSLIERSRARYWAETVTHKLSAVSDDLVFSPHQVVGATAPDVLLLSYYVGPNATFMMYGRGGHLASRRIDIRADELHMVVEDVRNELLATPSRRGPREEATRSLSRMLLKGVDATGMRAVLVLPDGPLWSLPFDALQLDDGRRLGDVAPVVAAPGIHVLRAMRTVGQRSHEKVRLFVVARPELKEGLPDLPGAERQAELLARLFPSAVVLSGPAATWAATRGPLTTSTHVHFAAHAKARPGEQPSILLCDGHGGAVHVVVDDVAALSLHSELIFLAACTTSLGAGSSGEGLISIARAFLFAGARCVIGTLWPVPEDQTEIFVDAFYGELARGSSVLESLHAAKVEARDKGVSARTWAAFQGVGDFLAEIDHLSVFVERAKLKGA